MRVGSLFSGIGGIELGLERAGGFETVWFVENEPHAQAVLRKHWPDAIIYDDVTTVDFKTVPRIDILTGGFPCQDISNAGKRDGIEGSRSGLWKHCVRAIRDLRPQIAVFENVSALTRRGLDRVLCDLAAIGYDAEWHCISASAVGAPHRRDRIAIIAHPNTIRVWESQVLWPPQYLAHPDGERQLHGQPGELADKGWEPSQRHIGEGSTVVADTPSKRLEESRPSRQQELRTQTTEGMDHRLEQQGCWAVEPGMGRVAHGVPHRVDRIKRLGNAVVPAWAQAIGEAINKSRIT